MLDVGHIAQGSGRYVGAENFCRAGDFLKVTVKQALPAATRAQHALVGLLHGHDLHDPSTNTNISTLDYFRVGMENAGVSMRPLPKGPTSCALKIRLTQKKAVNWSTQEIQHGGTFWQPLGQLVRHKEARCSVGIDVPVHASRDSVSSFSKHRHAPGVLPGDRHEHLVPVKNDVLVHNGKRSLDRQVTAAVV